MDILNDIQFVKLPIKMVGIQMLPLTYDEFEFIKKNAGVIEDEFIQLLFNYEYLTGAFNKIAESHEKPKDIVITSQEILEWPKDCLNRMRQKLVDAKVYANNEQYKKEQSN